MGVYDKQPVSQKILLCELIRGRWPYFKSCSLTLLSGNLSTLCSSASCAFVCDECFLERKRRIRGQCLRSAMTSSLNTSGNGRASVCVCEKGELQRNGGGFVTHQQYGEKEKKRGEKKNTVYLMHTDKKKGCITSVNTSSQPPSSNESQTKAYTNSGPCLCWREKKKEML